MATQKKRVEVAYRRPGEGWKRAVKTDGAQLEKFLEKLSEDGAEVRTREAEV